MARDTGYPKVPSGNIRVDFVWGNIPGQPNDDRGSSPSYNATGGGTGDKQWSTTTDIASDQLTTTPISRTLGGLTYTTETDNHVRIINGWSGYPSYTPNTSFPTSGSTVVVPNVVGLTLTEADRTLNVAGFNTSVTYRETGATAVDLNAVVTGASASGGVVTYTSENTFTAGQIVTITGLSTSAFNLSSVVIASANNNQFTVTNAATGTTVTGATASAHVQPNGGTVYSQSPAAAASSTQGATVALVVYDVKGSENSGTQSGSYTPQV